MFSNKKRTKLNSILISALSIITILFLFSVAFLWSEFNNKLNVSQINFSETNVLDNDIYNMMLSDLIGTNHNKINLSKISKVLESHPYVKATRVSNIFPGKIQIEIIEREPIALLNTQPMLMLDAEGYVLPNEKTLKNYNLPILTNFNPSLKLYPSGEKALSVKVNECIYWINKIRFNYSSHYKNLSEIKITSTNDMELILFDYPTHIYLGNDQLWSRINILKEFEKELGSKKITDFNYLDIRYDNQIIAKRRRS